jgi:hypothetical protein
MKESGDPFMKKYIGSREIMLITLTLAIVVAGFFITSNLDLANINKAKTSGNVIGGDRIAGNMVPIIINFDNFAEYASSQKLVKELPSNAEISIKFYNFDSGQRQFDAIYTMTKGKVEKREAISADIEIMINSKYLPQIGNLCQTLQEAAKNGDVSYQTNLNSAALLWKYRGMMKYKDCFGI